MTIRHFSGRSGRLRLPAGAGRGPQFLFAALLFAGCVGPKYEKPAAETPAAYKELTPADAKNTEGWKTAAPKDGVLKGKWWEMYGDPELNALEEKVNISNQNVAAALASYAQARAMVREARSQYFPTLSVNPSAGVSRVSANAPGSVAGTYTQYSLPLEASWAPDLFGRVANTVKGNVAAAQASAADLENTRLTAQAQLAVAYFQLRSQDSLREVLDATVVAYRESSKLTRALFETGIDSEESVAEAETQLDSTEAQATGVGVARAQYEHAIALLTGQAPSSLSVPSGTLTAHPPAIPFGVPSELLERRPDVAANERLMAQANAQIGVAVTAYYPTLTLTASAGFESSSLSNLLSWPSRVWALGASLAETIFDAGLRGATVEQFQAAYDQTVANYRQTVLTAFQQVEDNLAALRILSKEIGQQETAIRAAERSLAIATDRYRLGIDPYLNVITAQTTLLSNRQTLVSLRSQQMVASVQLIEALGGGWDSSQMPSGDEASSGEKPDRDRTASAKPAEAAQSP